MKRLSGSLHNSFGLFCRIIFPFLPHHFSFFTTSFFLFYHIIFPFLPHHFSFFTTSFFLFYHIIFPFLPHHFSFFGGLAVFCHYFYSAASSCTIWYSLGTESEITCNMIVFLDKRFGIWHNCMIFHVPEDWESRWVESTHKGSEQGKFVWSAGKFYGDAEKDKGEKSLR